MRKMYSRRKESTLHEYAQSVKWPAAARKTDIDNLFKLEGMLHKLLKRTFNPGTIISIISVLPAKQISTHLIGRWHQEEFMIFNIYGRCLILGVSTFILWCSCCVCTGRQNLSFHLGWIEKEVPSFVERGSYNLY